MAEWQTPTNFIFTLQLDIDSDYKTEIFEKLRAQAVKLQPYPAETNEKQSTVNYKLCSASSVSSRWYGDNTYDFLIQYVTSVIKQRFGDDITIGDNWFLIYRGEEETLPHTHMRLGTNKETNLVAILYLNAPKGSGELYFPKREYSITPTDDLLVVHYANELHGVHANTDPNIERICLVVNYNT